MNDPLDLKQFIRTVNDFPIKGIKFRDITSLIENPIAFRLTCDELTKITKKFDGNIIASIESRGFIFAGTIARDLGLLSRNQNDSKSVQEIDLKLREMDPVDPVKYDYALFGLGVYEKF